MAKLIVIIGAGASGLPGIKCCLDEGHTPVCIERTDNIGGLWNYTDEVREGQACVMKSTVINTSKEIMAFSDFPIPKEYPNFMHNSDIMKYFNLYADHFGLKKYIRFNTEVVHLAKANDFQTSGRWSLEVKDLKTGDVKTETYDGVLVCTGHHAEPYFPSFPGIDKFKGEVIHTHQYKKPLGMEDKRVLVIGLGNSGGDAAVEIGRIASKVFLSTRRGTWVINRVEDYGLPVDVYGITRLNTFLPQFFEGWIAELKANSRFNHERYSLKPKHRIFEAHPFVNDDLPNRIICGSVVIKCDIQEFTETGVRFKDDTFEDNIDVVLVATGFKFGFPYIDPSILKVENNQVTLYKYVFPANISKHTLAVIGCIQPWGAIMPISELQCRWATRVFKGLNPLPQKEVMLKDITKKRTEMAKRYVSSQRHTIQVDAVEYMDELASKIGCKPKIGRYFFTDYALAKTALVGPICPYQYRLEGPGAWPGARQAIMTQWDRIEYPTRTRQESFYSPIKQPSSPVVGLIKLLAFLVLVVAIFIGWLLL